MFPADAGMNRIVTQRDRLGASVPRGCGDEPDDQPATPGIEQLVLARIDALLTNAGIVGEVV